MSLYFVVYPTRDQHTLKRSVKCSFQLRERSGKASVLKNTWKLKGKCNQSPYKPQIVYFAENDRI